jgi:hypothetical protein
MERVIRNEDGSVAYRVCVCGENIANGDLVTWWEGELYHAECVSNVFRYDWSKESEAGYDIP